MTRTRGILFAVATCCFSSLIFFFGARTSWESSLGMGAIYGGVAFGLLRYLNGPWVGPWTTLLGLPAGSVFQLHGQSEKLVKTDEHLPPSEYNDIACIVIGSGRRVMYSAHRLVRPLNI